MNQRRPVLSIIIPCLNERHNIGRLLDRLGPRDGRHQVLVVDGGSQDGSIEAARDRGAQVLRSPPGRGQQLRKGAAFATGEVLLFLHADCRLTVAGLEALEARLGAQPDCPGGNFRLLFDGDSGFSRWLTRFYAWIRRHGVYYGDSGVFVRRQVYRQLGGIRPISLMEDYDFTRRLEGAGRTCCIQDPPLITSSRRFQNRQPLAIVSGWLLIHLLYHLGVAPERLERLYRSKSHAPKCETQVS